MQNYTLGKTAPPATSWTLKKRLTKLDDEDAPNPADFAHLMTLKKVCELFTDELQQELSELMYKESFSDPAATQEAFCNGPAAASPPPPPSVRRRRAAEAGEATGGGDKSKAAGQKGKRDGKKGGKKGGKKASDDAPPSMEEMLKK